MGSNKPRPLDPIRKQHDLPNIDNILEEINNLMMERETTTQTWFQSAPIHGEQAFHQPTMSHRYQSYISPRRHRCIIHMPTFQPGLNWKVRHLRLNNNATFWQVLDVGGRNCGESDSRQAPPLQSPIYIQEALTR